MKTSDKEHWKMHLTLGPSFDECRRIQGPAGFKLETLSTLGELPSCCLLERELYSLFTFSLHMLLL